MDFWLPALRGGKLIALRGGTGTRGGSWQMSAVEAGPGGLASLLQLRERPLQSRPVTLCGWWASSCQSSQLFRS